MTAAAIAAPTGRLHDVSIYQNKETTSPVHQSWTRTEIGDALRDTGDAERVTTIARCTVATCKGKTCPWKLTSMGWSLARLFKGTTRANVNVESVSGLVLDYDHLTEETLEQLLAALAPFDYFLHNSHNDRPGDRCVRVVIATDQDIPGHLYPALWDGVTTTIGVKVDSACRDASRLMFVPNLPADVEHLFRENRGAPIVVSDYVDLSAPAPARAAPTAKRGDGKAPEDNGNHVWWPPGDAPVFTEPPSEEFLAYAWELALEHGPSIKKQGGNNHAYALGALLFSDLGLSPEHADPIWQRWRDHHPETREWDTERLAVPIYNAERYAKKWLTTTGKDGKRVKVTNENITDAPGDARPVAYHRGWLRACWELGEWWRPRPPAPPSDDELRGTLRAAKATLEGKKRDAAAQVEKVAISRLLGAAKLAAQDDADKENALRGMARAGLKYAPADTTRGQIAALLMKCPEVATLDRAMVYVDQAAEVLAQEDKVQGEHKAVGNGEFSVGDEGKPLPTQRNIDIALQKLGVAVRHDVFADRSLIDGLEGFGPHLDDAAVVRLLLAIDKEFHFRPAKEFFYDVIGDRARLNSFHPVRDYLDSLVWDGVPRLETWLIDLAGVEDTPYARAVSRITLVAAVRRVRSPGCKFDEMLILEDPIPDLLTWGS